MEEYRRWEDNIKMDLKEIGVNVRIWIDSSQDRDYWRVLVNLALNLRVTEALELTSVCVRWLREAQPILGSKGPVQQIPNMPPSS